ncbi:UBX domain-containing protein 4 [Madurella mycetomatis]|uniref:UBX domain-containing protein 2 n=1 Tax=Madurella mycetomatis TaxID=100816 RepID=A0A175WBA7_9PEZI|nr:UBX domain-containing protein 4 [Madurella mycetomatis]
MAFFQGSLQEGIAAALQQAKAVVCFVTDGEAESKLWEDEYLADGEISSLLQSRAVTLRLPAGSQEEGFLAQLYPIPKKPTIVVIKNAELKEYIAAGVTKDEFLRRIKTALVQPQTTSPQPQPTPPQSQPVVTPAAPPSQPGHVAESSTSSSGQATPPTPNESQVQSLLTERAARLAEKKRKDEEEAKRQRAEKAKAKAEAEASGSKKPDAQSKHAEALRRKQREAREERQRILKAIEDDKVARKAKQAELEAERKAAQNQNTVPFAPASQLLPSTGKLSEHCSLQVRLFDGSTIRSRFSSEVTLKDVRKWVDDTRQDGKAPYTFKVLLTPLPSKRIDVTEEGKSLQSLELAPSSTLILVPVPKYTAAYGSAAGTAAALQGNIFQRLIAYFLGIITGFFGAIFTFFSTLLSTNDPPAPPEPAAASPSRAEASAGAGPVRRGGRRIAGLDHSDERRGDQQFYNGNSTNFEPRPDDEE